MVFFSGPCEINCILFCANRNRMVGILGHCPRDGKMSSSMHCLFSQAISHKEMNERQLIGNVGAPQWCKLQWKLWLPTCHLYVLTMMLPLHTNRLSCTPLYCKNGTYIVKAVRGCCFIPDPWLDWKLLFIWFNDAQVFLFSKGNMTFCGLITCLILDFDLLSSPLPSTPQRFGPESESCFLRRPKV